MITRSQKEAQVAKIKENIAASRALFLTNLVGLDSNTAVSVRKNVRDANGAVVITRNTLFELAAKGTKAEGVLKNLKGNNAVAFAFEDAPGVAKALYDASKEHEEIVFLSAGLLGDEELSKEKIIELAKLPSRDQMLATLLATFNAPLSAFVRVMDAVKRKKEEGGEVTATQVAENSVKDEAPTE